MSLRTDWKKVPPLARVGVATVVISLVIFGISFGWAWAATSFTTAFEILVGDKAPSSVPAHVVVLDFVALVGWLIVPALTGTVVAIVVEYRVRVGERKEREQKSSHYK